MVKKIDAVDEVRKTRETTYKKCNYNLRKYCEFVSKEAETFQKEKKAAKHDNKKAA